MKRLLFLTVAIVFINTSVKAELLEMATSCDKAVVDLTEILKHPNKSTSEQIRDAFGVDIFNSCDSPYGKTVCFQCLDKNQKLNLIQLQENKAKKIFELKGFGCKCDRQK